MKKVWMSNNETAKHLGVSRRTMYDWRTLLNLPYYIVGATLRFEMGEIDRWVEEQKAKQYKWPP